MEALVLFLALSQRPLVVVSIKDGCPLVALYRPRWQQLAKDYPINLIEVSKPGRLPATRSPEAFVLCRGRIVYQGRIDDQFAVGVRKSKPTRDDLAMAIREVLAGQPVTVPRTLAVGCAISEPNYEESPVTYDQVASILHRCSVCHRPGQPGPFALLTYADARAWASPILEAVESGRMPPWGAVEDHFRNDPSLSAEETTLLRDWVHGGCKQGHRDAVDTWPPGGWSSRPDLVLVSPVTTVAAWAVLDNRWFELRPNLPHDQWVSLVEVKPDNPRVVHHCTVFIGPAGSAMDQEGLRLFSDYTPGRQVISLPTTAARRIPAGWSVYLSVHYVPTGKPEVDHISLGLTFAPASEVNEVLTLNNWTNDFELLPGQRLDVQKDFRIEQDCYLLSMCPHMHLRGSAFSYEVILPSGRQQSLLTVPRYDFSWQSQYALQAPLLLPKGSVIRCNAIFDNSNGNPNNPDSSATVAYGPLSTDEMFHGYFDVMIAPRSTPIRTPILAVLLIVGLFGILRLTAR